MAAKRGDYGVVARMMDEGYAGDQAVNVNYQEPSTLFSALHYAVQANDKKLTNLLVKNYADVKAQDANK